MRLDSSITNYLDSPTAAGRCLRTIDAYRRDLALFAAHLGGERGVANVTPAHHLDFASSPAVRQLRDGSGARHPMSVNWTRSAIGGLFDFLQAAENPLRRVDMRPPPGGLVSCAVPSALKPRCSLSSRSRA